jgi:hypothetical protein
MKITVDQFKDASWEGNFDIVKEYVESGGDVNACASKCRSIKLRNFSSASSILMVRIQVISISPVLRF